MIISLNTIRNLYQPDLRRGDRLIEPQRSLNRVWRELVRPLNTIASKVAQVAARVMLAALLVVPTAAAYLLGFVGIVIKACQPAPRQPLLDLPVMPGTSDARLEVPETLLAPPAAGAASFTSLPLDVQRYVASFLPTRDLLALSQASRASRAIARSDVIWEPLLIDLGVMGPVRMWSFARVRNGAGSDLTVVPVGNQPVIAGQGAYDQAQAYHELKMQDASRFPVEFDYLARLIKGGPIAFKNLPRLPFAQTSGVLPEQMSSSFMIGVDPFGRNVMALRLIEPAQADPRPFVLFFVRDAQPTIWHHAACGPFAQDQIKLTNTKHLNYLLNLIKGEDFGDQLPVGFSNTLELYN